MDLMARRRAMMGGSYSIVPDGYQLISYLENSGTQYILSDYIPDASKDLSCELKYAFTAQQTGDKMLFGSVGGSSRVYAEKYNHGQWYCGIGTKAFRNVMAGFGGSLNVPHELTMTQSTLKIDNGQIAPNANFSLSSMPNMCLFAWNSNGTVQYINSGLRIYYLWFKEDGILTASFAPCIRKADGEPGMYDLVAGKFYGNAGTGNFITP